MACTVPEQARYRLSALASINPQLAERCNELVAARGQSMDLVSAIFTAPALVIVLNEFPRLNADEAQFLCNGDRMFYRLVDRPDPGSRGAKASLLEFGLRDDDNILFKWECQIIVFNEHIGIKNYCRWLSAIFALLDQVGKYSIIPVGHDMTKAYAMVNDGKGDSIVAKPRKEIGEVFNIGHPHSYNPKSALEEVLNIAG